MNNLLLLHGTTTFAAKFGLHNCELDTTCLKIKAEYFKFSKPNTRNAIINAIFLELLLPWRGGYCNCWEFILQQKGSCWVCLSLSQKRKIRDYNNTTTSFLVEKETPLPDIFVTGKEGKQLSFHMWWASCFSNLGRCVFDRVEGICTLYSLHFNKPQSFLFIEQDLPQKLCHAIYQYHFCLTNSLPKLILWF